MKHYITLNFIRPRLRTNLRAKIKRLQDDHGGECTSNDFSQFCAEHGIIHEVTPPYSPQSNGVAERKNQTLIDFVNAMLERTGMPYEWWGKLS
jgi:transposase InsO family protein